MRIIDKNTDFYDYLQNVYQDNTIVFDRTDSFLVTKEIMCNHLLVHRGRSSLYNPRNLHDFNFVLLQVCNTFWLFLVEVIKTNDNDDPVDYTIDLLATWKSYNKERALIKLDVVSFTWDIDMVICRASNHWRYERSNIEKKIDTLIQAINSNNYRTHSSIDSHTIRVGNGKRIEKHIPILKACGIANLIDPLDVYLSLEEYFSLERSSSERTESSGITDKEKIENHGFDSKISFRGKT